MKQEWIGLREFARRCGRRHRAAQKAIEDGRIPAEAVRRGDNGRIFRVEYHLASAMWAERTDLDQALRTAAPLREAPAPVQTSAPAQAADSYLDEERRFSHALIHAFLRLPAIAGGAGLAEPTVDQVLGELFGAMREELEARGEPEAFIARELAIFRQMVAEERAHPGALTA